MMRFAAQPLGGSRLVRDYLAGVPAARAFYFGSPWDRAAFVAKARALAETDGAERRARAASVVRPLGQAARRKLGDVVEAGGWFVTTGQQPGLFGGPLYGLYKTLSAQRLAETLEETLGKPVMPVFWMASDDHDWHEAAHAAVVDADNQLVRLALGDGATGAGRLSLARVLLGPDVSALADRLAAALPASEFRSWTMDLIRRSYRPESTMAEGYAALIGRLLEGSPLGLVDAADPAVREAICPLARAETADAGRSAQALAETAARLAAEGYGLQVRLIEGALNVFLDTPEGRDRLQRAASGFRLRRSGAALDPRRLGETIAAPPFPASPNVLLRPVAESFLLPTLAYVGGPAELAYLGQIGGLFRLHGLTPPIAVPRASLVVVERKVERVLAKFGLSPAETRDGALLANRLARAEMPEAVSEPLGTWRRSSEAQAAELADAVRNVDATLQGAVQAARNTGLAALGALETKISRALKRKNATTLEQIEKARTNLWPDGKAQERVLGPLQYVARYGPEFVDRAREAVRTAWAAKIS